MLSLAELTKHCYMIPSKSQNAESNRMSNVLTFLLTKIIDSFRHGKVLDWYSTAKHTSKFNYFLIIAKQDKPKIDNLFKVTECLLHELSLIIEIYKYSSRHLVLHVDWINVNYTQWSCCSVLIIHWNSISTL